MDDHPRARMLSPPHTGLATKEACTRPERGTTTTKMETRTTVSSTNQAVYDLRQALWLLHGDEATKEFFAGRREIEGGRQPTTVTWRSLLYALRHGYHSTVQAIARRICEADEVAALLCSAARNAEMSRTDATIDTTVLTDLYREYRPHYDEVYDLDHQEGATALRVLEVIMKEVGMPRPDDWPDDMNDTYIGGELQERSEDEW